MEYKFNGGCLGILVILLGVLFIGLKLTEQIAWPWFWVLSPFWIYFCLFSFVLFVMFMLGIIIAYASR